MDIQVLASVPQGTAVRLGGMLPETFHKGAGVTNIVSNTARRIQKATTTQLRLDSMRKAAAPASTDSTSNLQTQMQVNYQAMFSDFVAMVAAPPVDVDNIAGGYWNWDDSEIVTARAEAIQPEAPAVTFSDSRTLKSYAAVTYGARRIVSDEEIRNEAQAVMSAARATMFSIQAVLQRLEQDINTFYGANSWGIRFTGGGTGTNPDANAKLTTTTRWSFQGAGESNPIRDLLLAMQSVHRHTGGTPNVLVLGPPVFRTLMTHPLIVGRIDRGQTMGTATVNEETLAALFGVNRVVQAKSRQSTSEYFLSNHALLLTAPNPKGVGDRSALMTAMFGPQGTEMGIQVRTYYDEAAAGTWVEARLCYDIVQQDQDGACLFMDIIA